MSPKYRNLLDGIHLADSVTWNPHKMMGIVLQCSAFLTKHEVDLLDVIKNIFMNNLKQFLEFKINISI